MMSGKLDRRVVIQSFSETENALGEVTQSWSDVATRWVSVSYGTGQERREAAQERSTLTATFFVRSEDLTRGITPQTNRLQYDGLTWDISSTVPSVKRRDHIAITATARTS